ncbi:MAG TPA: hypothetical protein VHP38_05040 [Ruminiclostridium sp.]|nr:hypothetical protein [Ruminiclostridium sp.]
MKLKAMKQKAILVMTTIICISALANHAAGASQTAAKAPIIPLGDWSLGDTFDLVYGKENFTTYKYNDIQNLYNNNCYDKKMNVLSLEANNLQYQQYCIQYDELCQSIESYKQLEGQSKALAKTYEEKMNNSSGTEKDTAKQNMQQSLLDAQSYEKELAAAVLQKAEAYANRENSLFIKNNAQTLGNQQYVSDISALRNSIYELKLLNENYYLQGTNADYARLKASEQNISKSKDMAFQSDIDLYNSDYDYYTNQQELIEQEFDSQYEKLLYNCNIITNKGVVINTEIKSLRGNPLMIYDTYESGCITTDIKKKQIEDKMRIIDGKIAILKEYFSEDSNEVKLAQNEKLQATVELGKWLTERENIIKKFLRGI